MPSKQEVQMTTTIKPPSHFVCVTPYGDPLQWQAIGRCGFQTERNSDYNQRIHSNFKMENPSLQTRTLKASLVVVDIDDLQPSEYNWFCKAIGEDQAWVSHSGRPKTAFWVLHPDRTELLTESEAIESIRQRYGSDLADRCDKAGTRATFITLTLARLLHSGSFSVGEYVPAIKEVVDTTHKWNKWNGPMTESVRTYLGDKPKLVEDVLRHLLGNASYLMDGSFEAAGTYIAKCVDSSKSCVYRVLYDLRRDGILGVTDAAYSKVGKKAIRYKAKGILMDAARYIRYVVLPSRTKSRANLPEPANKEWNLKLFLATNFFQSEDEYMAWGLSLPGINQKDRKLKLKQSWASHIKRGNAAYWSCT